MKELAFAEASSFIFSVGMPCRLSGDGAQPAFSNRVTGIRSVKAWLHGPISAESRAVAFGRFRSRSKCSAKM
jgi:hypothetical protein